MTPPRPDPRVDPPTPPRPIPAIRPKALPPDQAPTVELDGIEILKGMLREMREDMRSEFRLTNANIESVATEVSSLQERVGLLEKWRVKEEGRVRRHSERVAALDDRSSSNDLAHEASIAVIQAEVQSMKKTVDAMGADIESTKASVDTVLIDIGLMAKSVNKIVASPTVKIIGAAIGGAIVTWLASKGIHLPALP